MKKESSPLHILNPTGFEIQLYKSIVKDDAYLPRYVKHPVPSVMPLTTFTYLKQVLDDLYLLYPSFSLIVLYFTCSVCLLC